MHGWWQICVSIQYTHMRTSSPKRFKVSLKAEVLAGRWMRVSKSSCQRCQASRHKADPSLFLLLGVRIRERVQRWETQRGEREPPQQQGAASTQATFSERDHTPHTTTHCHAKWEGRDERSDQRNGGIKHMVEIGIEDPLGKSKIVFFSSFLPPPQREREKERQRKQRTCICRQHHHHQNRSR